MEKNLNTNQPQTTEKIPHSGNLPGDLRETPMRHFDTPLAEAPVNPLDINDFTPTEVISTAPEKKKSRKGLLIGASAGLAGVALVAGSIMGISAATSGEKETEPPVTDPKGTVEVEEEAPETVPYAETILHGEALTQEFEIPTGLSDQELGTLFAERINDWENYGANPALDNELFEKGLNEDERLAVYTDLAQKNADAIAPGLFGDSWQDNIIISQFKDQVQKNNRVTLDLNATTSDKDYDEEAWSTRVEGVNTINKTNEFTLEGGRRLRIEFTVKDNSEKNRVDELTQSEQYPKEGVLTIVEATFMEVDGKEVAVEFDYGQHLY